MKFHILLNADLDLDHYGNSSLKPYKHLGQPYPCADLCGVPIVNHRQLKGTIRIYSVGKAAHATISTNRTQTVEEDHCD